MCIIATGAKQSCDVNQPVNGGGKHWLGFGIDLGKIHYHLMQDFKRGEVATLSYCSACYIS